MRLIKRMEGAISIFLCIIMVPMIMLTGVLVDGSRIRSGEAQVQQAVDSAAKSTLANYNNMLKDLYGVFALADNNQDNLKEEIEHYLNRTLMSELGIDKKTMGEKTYDYLKSIMVGEKAEDVNFFNMYDYRVENVKVNPIYNLSENEVLRNQILEYMKYRAPKALLEGFIDKLKSFQGYGKQSQTMQKKISVDKDLNSIAELQKKLADQIDQVNTYDSAAFIIYVSNYITAIATRIDKERQMQAAEKAMQDAKKALEDNQSQIDAVNKQIDQAKKDKQDTKSLEASLDALNKARTDLSTKYTTAQNNYNQLKAAVELWTLTTTEKRDKVLIEIDKYYGYNESASKTIDDVIKKSASTVTKINDIKNNDLKGDESDFSQKMGNDLSNQEELISKENLKPIQDKLNSNMKILQDFKKKFSELNPASLTPAMFTMCPDYKAIYDNLSSRVAPNVLRDNYISKYQKITEYKKPLPAAGDEKDPREETEKIANDSEIIKESKTDSAKKDNEKEKFPKDQLPSGGGKVASPNFDAEDSKYVEAVKNSLIPPTQGGYDGEEVQGLLKNPEFSDEDDGGFSENALGLIVTVANFIKDGLQNARDNIYINEYIMGTFKNTLTTSEKLKEPERDLRDNLKKDRLTYFDSGEVEYILTGSANERANTLALQGEILLIRFALNTIYIYLDSEKRNEALLAATAIAGWTGFGVPIVQTLIMLGWSLAESIIDVKELMEGKPVPIFKTKATWVLGSTNAINEFKKKCTEAVADTTKEIVDYGIDKAEDLAKSAVKRVKDVIDTKVGIAIDKAFEPVNNALSSTTDLVSSTYNKTVDNAQAAVNGEVNAKLGEIERLINDTINIDFKPQQQALVELMKKKQDELQKAVDQNVIKKISEEIKIKIEEERNKLKGLIIGKISKIQETIFKEIETAGNAGKEKLNAYIDSFAGKTSGGAYKNDIKSSLLSMTYQDYLRVFLFVKGEDTKLSRVADLIQLNMRKETKNDKFKLSDCNTYLRVEAEVSMKYLFLPQPFIAKKYDTSDRTRHPIKVLLYHGY